MKNRQKEQRKKMDIWKEFLTKHPINKFEGIKTKLVG